MTFSTWSEYREWTKRMADERPTEEECARRDAEEDND